ncbi:unnamed protein product [Rotaria sp. Silwood2]|nr:unnamed protein product [Rotaria sp. Silwood2]CAF2585386.1 unnamed protein product [Rotaria sp. Silwood2]CAF2997654.1 unnamed protein product [Rotaria sp. Silwood2]CAF3947925.1 unnamed protein product [Rotaria sp. Silwood2]CAF4079683.1 unnamed protein product [Rotaria sp. Silwood2]
MQNSARFYSEYNSYPIEDTFHSNALDASIESDTFGLSSSASMSTNQTSAISPPTLSGMARSNKRKTTTDTDVSYSPASIYSDNSNYSDASYPTLPRQSTDFSRNLSSSRHGKITTASVLTTSAEEGSSDDNDDDDDTNDLARKREKHTQVEAHRRALEKAHFRELSMLITNRSDSKSTKLHHLDLLKIAADEISKMNLRHKNDPLRPSNLTENELNFLTIEASNSFLFVTTIEPPSFRIIHVTDAINRILNVTPDQWLGQNFLSFIHPDDLIRFRSQLMSLNQRIGLSIHLECRLKQGNNDTYSSVIIDGMAKIIDNSLKPVQTNASGFLAFVGICHLPLITKYSETNMCLYKNPQLCTFRCRCSPNDWKIFLVDRSVSTLPSISYDLFRQKSVLDFIHTNEQALVHQALLRSITASTNETVTCHFIHPTLQTSIPMTLEIKSFFNTITHQANFIELTFKNSLDAKLEASIFDFIDEEQEIDKLLESDSSVSTQQTIEGQLHNNPTTQTTPYYFSNGWTTKNELY